MSASSADAVKRRRLGVSADVCVAAVLMIGCIDPAGAAVLGGMASSVGLLAALAALTMVGSWPEQVPADALPALASLVSIGAAAWWVRRTGLGNRAVAFVARRTGMQRASSCALVRNAPRVARPVMLPHGVERELLLAELESHYVQLQAAWDHGDMPALRELTTEEMLAELCACRGGCTSAAGVVPAATTTHVLALHAELLGYEELAQTCLVSVDFSGWVRDSRDGVALPFREVWMLMAARPGVRAWRLARHHALL